MLKIDFNGNLKWNSDNTLWQRGPMCATQIASRARYRVVQGDLEVPS